jgi:hypothetical protein
MNNDAYKSKYLKYKAKYLELKNMFGGAEASNIGSKAYGEGTKKQRNEIYNIMLAEERNRGRVPVEVPNQDPVLPYLPAEIHRHIGNMLPLTVGEKLDRLAEDFFKDKRNKLEKVPVENKRYRGRGGLEVNLNIFEHRYFISELLFSLLPFTPIKILNLDDVLRDHLDMERLIHVLPKTDVRELRLCGNNLRNIDELARVLPKTNIRILYLNDNLIENIDSLAEALPKTKIHSLFLNKNRLGNINSLAQVLPRTKITRLEFELYPTQVLSSRNLFSGGDDGLDQWGRTREQTLYDYDLNPDLYLRYNEAPTQDEYEMGYL